MARNKNNRCGCILNKRDSKSKSTYIRFLIICEGQTTEPYYFRSFPVESVEIIGEGYNTISLVERAIELRNEKGYVNAADQVWCVFDKDAFADNYFNAAIQKAEANGLNVAYSNEAFELWYLLHFDRHYSALHRNQYIQKLSEKLKKSYKKNDRMIYDLLVDYQPLAIKRAKELYQNHSSSPANDNPSTTVFKLVEELNKHINGNL